MRTAFLTLAALLIGTFAALGEIPSPPVYAGVTLALFDAPDPGTRPVGKLLIAAPLRFVGPAEAGWQRVTVSGWTQAGAERAVQAAPGLRVTRAALGKAGLDMLVFGDAREDPDTGLTWRKTTLTGWIEAGVATEPDLDRLWDRAETLFTTRCTACHERRIPARYTANQWTSYIKVMGPRTGLPKDDQALIRTFLQYRSADAAALARALGQE